MILKIYTAAAINFVVIVCCYSAISGSAAGTFDGVGAGLLAIGSLGLSLVLTLMSLICLLSEISKKRYVLRAVVATILAAAPFVVYYVGDVLPRKRFREQQHSMTWPNQVLPEAPQRG